MPKSEVLQPSKQRWLPCQQHEADSKILSETVLKFPQEIPQETVLLCINDCFWWVERGLGQLGDPRCQGGETTPSRSFRQTRSSSNSPTNFVICITTSVMQVERILLCIFIICSKQLDIKRGRNHSEENLHNLTIL